MDNTEFYIINDALKIHCKLDLPENVGPDMLEKSERKFPLLILIHGYTGHMEEPHIRAIAQAATECGYIVLRPEMYGHGKSDGQFRKHTMIKWLDQALAIVDYARTLSFVDDLYLAGHSQGGLLAILAGAMERDRLKALILLSPAILIKDEAWKGRLLGMTFNPEHIPDEVPNPDKAATASQSSLGGNYFRTAQFLPVDEAIAAVPLPVLIIHADADETVPVRYARDAAAAYDNCTLRIISGDTHCYDNHLDQVCDAVREFLRNR